VRWGAPTGLLRAASATVELETCDESSPARPRVHHHPVATWLWPSGYAPQPDHNRRRPTFRQRERHRAAIGGEPDESEGHQVFTRRASTYLRSQRNPLWAALVLSAVAVAVIGSPGLVGAATGVGARLELGKSNSVSATTTLNGTTSNPAFTLKNLGTGAGLAITVKPGKAPITVNADAGKATNLNADKLDGKDSTAFQTALKGKSCPEGQVLTGFTNDGSLNCDPAVTDSDDIDLDGDGFTPNEGDCNEANPAANPGATEIDNDIDDDCDGQIDEGVGDQDHDGYTGNTGDCDDHNQLRHPGQPEIWNGVDEDCDAQIDEGIASCDDGIANTYDMWDVSGVGSCVHTDLTNSTDVDADAYSGATGDCNDSNPAVNPGAVEVFNGIDDDCDALVDSQDNSVVGGF